MSLRGKELAEAISKGQPVAKTGFKLGLLKERNLSSSLKRSTSGERSKKFLKMNLP